MDRILNQRLANRLVSLPPAKKLSLLLSSDAAVLAITLVLVLLLLPLRHVTAGELLLACLDPVIALCALYLVGAYRAVVRFLGLNFLWRLLGAALLTMLASLLLAAAAGQLENMWNNSVLFSLLAFLLIGSTRFAANRFLHESRARTSSRSRALIYGAGEAGTQLAAALSVEGDCRPVGFVDDHKNMWGRSLMGLPVYAPSKLADLRKNNRFDRILLAVPSSSRARRRRILEQLETLATRVQVMPSVEDLVSGRKRVSELQEVQIDDLLGRDPVPPVESLLDNYIKEQCVLVTGAGGSIGSELCRQVLTRNVRKLVLFDVSEYALYKIESELRSVADERGCQLVPILGTVTDRRQILLALTEHGVDTVYHAAAYKHVSLLEQNILTGVHNNVFGTLNTVQAAIEAKVPHFVLISTDKAVRPTSVMGISKRVCELIIQALAATKPGMSLSMVRFGNVLASSGSVVPLFLKQIGEGGPVTVTHPNVTRYFMTIPEAAQLVIQAGAMGGNGEVFVLDMGSPVRITDLAERMIHLSGLQLKSTSNPDGDIAIEYTGLRAGEKMYEELLIGDNPEGTGHPRIFLARERHLPWDTMQLELARMQRAVDANQPQAMLVELQRLIEMLGEKLEVDTYTAFHAENPKTPALTLVSTKRSS